MNFAPREILLSLENLVILSEIRTFVALDIKILSAYSIKKIWYELS